MRGALLVCVLLVPLWSQPNCSCQPAVPAPGATIFTEQQEIWLGDAIAEHLGRTLRVVNDPEANARLEPITVRLLGSMNPGGVRPQVRLVDLPVANAFTLPGGRIYIATKLVAFVRSEDELAGVVAHELGHAFARDPAVDASRLFKEVLGVTSLGDRADVCRRYHELVERGNTAGGRKAARTHATQLAADQLGVCLMTRAGYDPEAQVSVFDRIAETEGKTGNWFSDLFGVTRPESKRLREMIRGVQAIAAGCAAPPSNRADASGFREWQSKVADLRITGSATVEGGVRLQPTLRGDLTNLRFSPDGKYILGQDESGINVLRREPLEVLFRIPAPDAEPAQFTPDSKAIVFHTQALHVEMWNVASREKAWARELSRRSGCLQSRLSPDGKVIACLDSGLDLSLMNVETGEVLGAKKDLFFRPQMALLAAMVLGPSGWVHMGFTPDGSAFIAAPVTGDDSVFAWNIATRREMSIPGALKNALRGGFAFLDADQVLAINISDPNRSGVFHWPTGSVLQTIALPLVSIERVTSSVNHVLIRPFGKEAVGVVDIRTQRIIKGSKLPAIDIHGDMLIAERLTGELGLYGMIKGDLRGAAKLPANDLAAPRTAAASDDLSWVAVSNRSRGAVWNVQTGKQAFQSLAFNGGYFAANSRLLLDVPSYDGPREVLVVDPGTRRIVGGPEIGDVIAKQMGPWLMVSKPRAIVRGKAPSLAMLVRDVALEWRDLVSGAPRWMKDYEDEAPAVFSSAPYDRIITAWRADTTAAQKAGKALPRWKALSDKAAAWVVQVLDAASGSVQATSFIESGARFRITHAYLAGDKLAIGDAGQNRYVVQSLSGGEPRRGFGRIVALHSASGQMLVENEPGQLRLEAIEGTEHQKWSLSSPVRFAQFSADGVRAIALTARQEVHTLNCGQAAK